MAETARPTVSVVIPAHDDEATLGGALTGVLSQTLAPLEVIVVDDGSSDQTARVAAAYEPHVRVVSQANAGPSAARNRGVELATGDLIALCDADDMWFPEYLESLVDTWERVGGGRRIVCSNAYLMGYSGVSYTRQVLSATRPRLKRQRMRMLQKNFATIFCLVPTDLYREVGGMDESMLAIEDWDFMIRLVLAGAEIRFQPKPMALYRRQETTYSARRDKRAFYERRMFERLSTDPRLTDAERAYVQQRLQVGSPLDMRQEGDEALMEGDYRSAKRYYRRAARLSPGDLKLLARRWSITAVPGSGPLWRRRMRAVSRPQ